MALFVLAGAIAGIISMVVFAMVHAMTISDIWFALPIMVVAGAMVGAALAWSFKVMENAMTVTRWLAYTGCYLGVLVVLCAGSLIVYEPVTTMGMLFGALGLQEADRLVAEALPFTIAFTVLASLAMTMLFGRVWWHFFPSLVTTALVMTFLGSNVVIIGLIELDSAAVPALAEFLTLVVVIVVVYAALMAVVVAHMRQSEPRVHSPAGRSPAPPVHD